MSSVSSASSSSSFSSPHVYDVIIVGGGISGLSSACYLLNHNCENILILEARDRVGGRTYSPHLPGNHWVDLGGAYIGPTQNRILRLAHEYGIQTEIVYQKGKSVITIKGNKSEYEGVVPSLSPFALLDVNHALRSTEKERKKINLLEPWLDNDGNELTSDTSTMEEWINNICETEEGKEMYKAVVRGICCVEPCEISVLAWMGYVHAARGTDILIGVEGGAQERHFKGGSQQVSERMKDKIGNKRVLMKKAVSTVNWDENRTSKSITELMDIEQGVDLTSFTSSSPIIISCTDGSSYRTRRLILAISPSLYSTIRFLPYFPLKKQPTLRIYMGSIIKTVTRYARPFWKEKGYNGVLFCLPPSSSTSISTEKSPIGYSYDDCHEEKGEDGQTFYGIMGFCFGNSGREWMKKTREERKEAICRQYAEAFDDEEATRPIDYYECNWNAEEYSKGCYSGVMPPGVISELKEMLRAEIAGINFAGTELAYIWPGYMNGAVESGERAAHEVLQRLGLLTEEFVIEEPSNPSWETQPKSMKTKWEEIVEDILPKFSTTRNVLLGSLIAALAIGLRWWRRG